MSQQLITTECLDSCVLCLEDFIVGEKPIKPCKCKFIVVHKSCQGDLKGYFCNICNQRYSTGCFSALFGMSKNRSKNEK